MPGLALALGALACNAPLPVFGPTPTPSATLTPTATATPTPSPSPTPSPTPVPAARIEQADEAMFNGDWSRASAEYQNVLAQSADPAQLSAAQLGLGKARLFGGDPLAAIEEFSRFLQLFPDSPQAADANFLLGEAYRANQTWVQAMDAYRRYLDLRPGVIDAYVQDHIAQAAVQQGDYTAAALAYAAALAAPRAGEPLDLRQKLAEVYAAQGDTANALTQYQIIFDTSVQDWRKAHAEVAGGLLLYNSGQRDAAYQKFLDAVNNYPDSGDTFQALITLVNDEVPVDELQRGLVNFYAANYEPAIAAFDRYREAYPNADATALYFKGRALAGLKHTAEAIATFRSIVQNHPADSYWTKAYFQIAFLLDYPDDTQTFVAFAAAAPQAPEAPDALYRAARLHERNDNLRNAAELWTRIASEYPNADQAADAAIQAGLVLYRAGDLATARQRFELAATLGSDAEQHARAWLWTGKALAQQGDPAGAQAAWIKASGLDPHGYYSLRAAELLRGEQPFTPPPAYSLDFDLAQEKSNVELWLRTTFSASVSSGSLSDLQPGIWQEGRFVRGAELWRLGQLTEAHAEFDSLRLDLQGDPLATWELAVYFNQIGAYDLGIRAARQVVDLAGYSDTLLAPDYLLRVRYPAPFAALVVPAAAENHLHPFLLLSKMRLESFFWKYAFSTAQARGLNQIIPATGDYIAQRLGLTGFQQADLFRPSVSIPMGAFYLDFVGEYVDHDPAGILAGYYAGPGNAQAWRALAQGDPDLFVEVIRLPDAKGYVQTAYEYFEEYKVLYGKK